MMAIGLWYESLRFKTLMFLDTKVKTGGIIECHHLCKTSYGMLELGCAPGQELAFVTEIMDLSFAQQDQNKLGFSSATIFR